jgi:large conductance mechanosensitive channel
MVDNQSNLKNKKLNNHIVRKIRKTRPLQGFIDFIRSHGVIALAIGIFLGTSLKSVVDSVVTNIVNPLVGLLTGNINFNNAKVCIKSNYSHCVSGLDYGRVISSIIEFLAAAFTIYLIVKLLQLDKLDKSKE